MIEDLLPDVIRRAAAEGPLSIDAADPKSNTRSTFLRLEHELKVIIGMYDFCFTLGVRLGERGKMRFCFL